MSAAALLKARLRGDLTAAMKARSKDHAALIRTLLAAIDNAEAPAQSAKQASASGEAFAEGGAEVARLELTSADLQRVIAHEAASRDAAADEMERGGRAEAATMLRAEAALVRGYLG